MSFPSVVLTHHLQARRRFFKTTSKTGNCSGIVGLSIEAVSLLFVYPCRRRFKFSYSKGRKYRANNRRPIEPWLPLIDNRPTIGRPRVKTPLYIPLVSASPINPVAVRLRIIRRTVLGRHNPNFILSFNPATA